MADFEIVAEARTDFGKSAMRRLRLTGKVPAIIYGTGQEPKAVQIAENYLRKQLENEAVYSHILTLKVDGGTEQAVIKDLQRHPATSRVTHLDFMRVSALQSITMQVPLHFENEADAPGVRQGGQVSHLIMEVEISCLPKDLPEFIPVDVSGMEIGDSIMLSQLNVPNGVELLALTPENDQPVASLQVIRDTVEEDADDETVEGDDAAADDAPTADGDSDE